MLTEVVRWFAQTRLTSIAYVVHSLSLSLARHYQNEKEMTYAEIG